MGCFGLIGWGCAWWFVGFDKVAWGWVCGLVCVVGGVGGFGLWVLG